MPTAGEQRNHQIDTAERSAPLVDRQRAFDNGSTLNAFCGQPDCRERPEYDYSFAVYSEGHRDWQQRHYFYCPEHMEIVARDRGLDMPVCLTITYRGDKPGPSTRAGIKCIFCGKLKANVRTTSNTLYAVVCSSCGAQSPTEHEPSAALAHWERFLALLSTPAGDCTSPDDASSVTGQKVTSKDDPDHKAWNRT